MDDEVYADIRTLPYTSVRAAAAPAAPKAPRGHSEADARLLETQEGPQRPLPVPLSAFSTFSSSLLLRFPEGKGY